MGETTEKDMVPNGSEIDPDTDDKTKLAYENTNITIVKPSRKIVIEPVLVLFAFCMIPMMQVNQLFVYGKLEEYVARKHHYNISFGHKNTSNHGNCDVNKTSFEYKFTEEVQTYNSYFTMITSVVNIVPQAFSIIFLTAYSDKAGRRYAIIPGLIAPVMRSLTTLLVYVLDLPVWTLWIGAFLNGIFGGYGLVFAGSFSYIADITNKENRTFRITVTELLMFFSSIIGPIGVGYLIQENGYLWPMVVAASGNIINLIYAFFCVPETIVKTSHVKFFTFEHFKHSAQALTRNTEDNRRWKLWLLIISFLIHYIGSSIFFVTDLFVLNIPLCWGAVTIGYYNTAIIGVSTVTGIAVAKLMKCFTSDAVIALTAAFVDTLNCIYKGLVRNTLMMFLTLIFAPYWNLLTPTTRAMMSTLVDKDEQGSIFGAVAIVSLIAELIGSQMMPFLYAETLHISPGFVFFVGSIFYFLTACMFIFYIIKSKREQNMYRRLESMDK